MPSLPNIVIYASHDTGRHIGPYGIPTVQTPNADLIAETGVVFQNAFCAAPTCSASRASLFTGRYPHAAGVNGLARASTGFTLNSDSVHLSQRLKSRDYTTALFGLAHEAVGGGSPETHLDTLRFDYVRHGYKGARLLVDEFDEWLAGRDSPKPFYAQICPGETHRNFQLDGAQPDVSQGVSVPSYLVESEELRDDLSWFQGSIKKWDDALGRLLGVLNNRGIDQDTILIVTTDHGVPYPRAKASLYDAGIEIMLMVRFPHALEAGSRYDDLVSNVDVLPTLLEAIGADAGPELQGQSFWPLLSGGSFEPRQSIFAERTYHTAYDPSRCARTSRYKYIRNFEAVLPDWYFSEGFAPHLSIIGVKNSVEIMKEMNPKSRPREELYDLENDPLEQNNLATDRRFAEPKEQMARNLAGWMRETNDPLLIGPIASPAFFDNLESLEKI